MKHFLFLWCLFVSVFSIGQEQTPSQTTQSQNPNLTQEKVSKQNKIEKRVKPIRPVISKESPKKEENPAEKQ
jgi:hypothetical protein